MLPKFQFPDIKDNPSGFGGNFRQPLRLGSCDLNQMRFPDLGRILEGLEFVEGYSEGVYATSIGIVSRRYEQTTMLLHGDEQIRLLSAPLEAKGRSYRTILVRKRGYPAAMQAGLEYLRVEGFGERIDCVLNDYAGTFLDITVSITIAYQLAPLLTHHWELAAGYQRAVVTSAGADVYFVDWAKEPDYPRRKVVVLSQFLPHMREVTCRASFEDASRLCVNELTL